MKKSLPQSVIQFESKYPEIWKAFAALGERCHETGPLDEKTRRLVKLGIASLLAMRVPCTRQREMR